MVSGRDTFGGSVGDAGNDRSARRKAFAVQKKKTGIFTISPGKGRYRLGSRTQLVQAAPGNSERASAPVVPKVASGFLPGRTGVPEELAMELGKILIADDHSLVRDGLKQLVRTVSPRVEFLETTNCGQTLEAVATTPGIDLVLFDLSMPDMDGFAALQRLTDSPMAVPVVVVSASEERREMQRALDLGALGFIPKSESNEVILSAIKLVLSGGIYIPPAMARISADPVLRAGLPAGSLTVRQNEVLAGMMRGLSNKEIARELGLAEVTVKTHVSGILRVFGVSSRTRAVLAARKYGYGA